MNYFSGVSLEFLITIINPMKEKKSPIKKKYASASTAKVNPNRRNANPTFCFFIFITPCYI